MSTDPFHPDVRRQPVTLRLPRAACAHRAARPTQHSTNRGPIGTLARSVSESRNPSGPFKAFRAFPEPHHSARAARFCCQYVLLVHFLPCGGAVFPFASSSAACRPLRAADGERPPLTNRISPPGPQRWWRSYNLLTAPRPAKRRGAAAPHGDCSPSHGRGEVSPPLLCHTFLLCSTASEAWLASGSPAHVFYRWID